MEKFEFSRCVKVVILNFEIIDSVLGTDEIIVGDVTK